MTLRDVFPLIRDTFREWSEDEAPRHAAALSYYTAFSLAPLLLVVIAITSLFYGREAITDRLSNQFVSVVGENGAEVIETLVASAAQQDAGGIAAVIGIVTALFGAAGLFGNLQAALNAMWDIEPKPGRGIVGMLQDRFLSFTMVLGIGFLLLVSLIISSALSSLNEFITGYMPGLELIASVIGFIVSLAVITFFFAAIFKVLPDATITWRDVWIGALATAVLFTVGQYILGWYLANNDAGAAYGTAGSFIALLLWVYYSAQILLFGAEFTQVYAMRFGSHIQPEEDARWAPDADIATPAARPLPIPPQRTPVPAPIRSNRRTNPATADLDARPLAYAFLAFVAGLIVARR